MPLLLNIPRLVIGFVLPWFFENYVEPKVELIHERARNAPEPIIEESNAEKILKIRRDLSLQAKNG
jgi:hypothetical protein